MPIASPFAALLGAMPMSDHSVEVLGSTTRYWEYGPKDAATTIVIAHGYRGDHHGLEPVIAQFVDVRFIGPDMPGFGESTPLTEVGHDVSGYAAWLGAFIDTLGLSGTALVIGHSFGSIISSYAAANGLITPPQLMLINPIAQSGLDGPNQFMTKVTVGFYRLSGKMPPKFARWLLSHWLIAQLINWNMVTTTDKSLKKWIYDQHHTYFNNFSDPSTVVEAFEASISADVGEVGARIPMPTLLVGAELDTITPVSALHELESVIPDARLHVLDGVGHLIHYERARETAQLIVDFVGAGGLASPSAHK
ncbi:MAG: alpha/beta fold hydrolase [Microbacteriaceae bacterium]